MKYQYHVVLLAIFFLLLLNSTVTGLKIGLINNASLTGSTLKVNGTCFECICRMLLSRENIQSLNCFSYNNTCELFTNYLPSITYEIEVNLNSELHFLQLPSLDNEILTTIRPVTSVIPYVSSTSEIPTRSSTTFRTTRPRPPNDGHHRR